jgi:glucose-1-phosphate thymidylyltransferase
MYLGDNLVVDGIVGFVERFRQTRPEAMILLSRVPAPERFGVAELRDGQVVRLEEKPKAPRSDLALVGVYLFTSRIFEAVNSIRPSARGELEITDAIQWLVDQGARVEPHVVEGWWKDTGRLEDILEANRIMLDAQRPRCDGTLTGSSRLIGKVVIEEDAEIVDSVIRGPVIVGRGARVVNSYVGPFTSLSPRVEIRNSEIEHSIVLENSQIVDVRTRIEDSLIGKDVIIRHTAAMPRALRFMLGDHSDVEVA